jgi:hypothetical protein
MKFVDPTGHDTDDSPSTFDIDKEFNLFNSSYTSLYGQIANSISYDISNISSFSQNSYDLGPVPGLNYGISYNNLITNSSSFNNSLNNFSQNYSIIQSPTVLAAAGNWWDPRTYMSLSKSDSLLGKGYSINNGVNQSTTSLDLIGSTLDFQIGSLPPAGMESNEISVGLGKFISIGVFYANPDYFGYQSGGIAIHAGWGLAPPINFTYTAPGTLK